MFVGVRVLIIIDTAFVADRVEIVVVRVGDRCADGLPPLSGPV